MSRKAPARRHARISRSGVKSEIESCATPIKASGVTVD